VSIFLRYAIQAFAHAKIDKLLLKLLAHSLRMEMVSNRLVLIGLRHDRSVLKETFKDQFIATKIDRSLAEFYCRVQKNRRAEGYVLAEAYTTRKPTLL
jgi:hypothetical protein